jgi:1-acyl-sn-glycerol-3-phosphate acyltransferase
MWLLPASSIVSRVASRAYYRLTVSGGRVPSRGPVLLVANHPNSLLDPLLVTAAAGRGVRFLAKAPIFSDVRIGWLVRGAGAIPVYRQIDDPSQMRQNVGMFRAVHEALAHGAAVGIFPEGISHGEPSLAPLRTGAARIALGAFSTLKRTFPIVPVGLVFRRKNVFRSDAAVIVGEQVDWADLAPRDADDPEAVRELTRRITEALRGVTVNLEQWADRPLADCAVRVWEAEFSSEQGQSARVSRLRTTTTLLAHVREDESGRWDELMKNLVAHCRRLRRLGLHPMDLKADVSLARGLLWSTRRLFLLPAAAIALLGYLVFWPPYRATGFIVDRLDPDDEMRSTYKLLGGALFHALWVGTLTIATFAFAGPNAAALVLLLVPAAGIVGHAIRERWRGAWRDARRFFLLRSRRELVVALRERQQKLATRLGELYHAMPEGTRSVEP